MISAIPRRAVAAVTAIALAVSLVATVAPLPSHALAAGAPLRAQVPAAVGTWDHTCVAFAQNEDENITFGADDGVIQSDSGLPWTSAICSYWNQQDSRNWNLVHCDLGSCDGDQTRSGTIVWAAIQRYIPGTTSCGQWVNVTQGALAGYVGYGCAWIAIRGDGSDGSNPYYDANTWETIVNNWNAQNGYPSTYYTGGGTGGGGGCTQCGRGGGGGGGGGSAVPPAHQTVVHCTRQRHPRGCHR